MCRWLAYSGTPIRLEELLVKRDRSLIDQSLHSRLGATTTNGAATTTALGGGPDTAVGSQANDQGCACSVLGRESKSGAGLGVFAAAFAVTGLTRLRRRARAR